MKKIFTLMLLVLATLGTNAQVEWTIWEGTIAMGGWGQLYTNGEVFKPLEAGDAIKCYITYSASGTDGDYHEIYIQYTYGSSETSLKEQKDLTSDVTSVSYILTGDDISNLSQGNIKISGKGFTLNKLAVVKNKSVIKHTISETSKTYDGSGEDYIRYVEDENNHDYLGSGDYVLVTRETCATDNDDEIQICASDKNSGENWKSGTTIHSKGNFLGTIESSLNMSSSRVFIIQGKSFNFTGAYAYHPLPSFSIGSIGYATFSADQQVTAPNTVTAYKATVNGSSVTLTQFTNNVIPANTGAIIAGDEGAVLEFTASSESTTETSELIACTTATDVTTLAATGYDLYVLYSAHNSSDGSALLSGFGNWAGTRPAWDSSSKTLTWSEATGNSQGGWVGADWSAYDYVKINISSNSLDAEASFNIAYENSATTSSATLSAGSTDAVIIYLDATAKSNQIGNFQISSGTSASKSLTISSVELVTITPEFRKSTSGTLAANKAYLNIPSSPGAPSLSISFDGMGNTTGISNVQKTAVEDNRIYNLNGQEVKNAGKGIFIKNGKKYIIK